MRKRVVMVLLMPIIVLAFVSSSMAEETVPAPEQSAVEPVTTSGQCREIITLLTAQEQKNSREFRQIKRDIAALTQEVAEPGLSEILGGLGYIFGLFGVAAYVASRKRAGGGGK